jgi:hypothetical protein
MLFSNKSKSRTASIIAINKSRLVDRGKAATRLQRQQRTKSSKHFNLAILEHYRAALIHD